jgi:hypothetical protein
MIGRKINKRTFLPMKHQNLVYHLALAIVLIGSLILLFNHCTRHVMASTPPDHPVLELTEENRDLGHTELQNELKIPFRVTNRGGRRLVINQFDADCGCGSPGQDTIIIPPGQSRDVFVTLDTRFETGLVERKSSFSTSDPNHPEFVLTARTNVLANQLRPIQPTPEYSSVLVNE